MIRSAYFRQSIILAIGDIVAYLVSLIFTLTIRYGHIPGRFLLSIHLPAFSILFLLFLIINYSAGLYNRQSLLSDTKRVLGLLIRSQIIAALISTAFFYFAPVAIAPKANLFIYVVISTAILAIWRLVMFPVVSKFKNDRAILIGSGEEINELKSEINSHARYGFMIVDSLAPTSGDMGEIISNTVKKTQASVIVADLHNNSVGSAISSLYSLIFSGLQVIDAARLYESIFDRIPLSMVGERWLVENTGTTIAGRRSYDLLKRIADIGISLALGLLSLVFYPFVYMAIKLEDRGPIFIVQERVGKNGQIIKIIKFRSMAANDSGAYVSGGKTHLKITKVGRIIRLTRIDELPQLWNVLRGDISIIGPRPELPALVSVYEKEIPYYHVRHLIKPGLSGWAQIYHEAHPHHAVAVDDTRDKLSYDLYYVKHRSFMLDIRIALQTLRALISRRGV